MKHLISASLFIFGILKSRNRSFILVFFTIFSLSSCKKSELFDAKPPIAIPTHANVATSLNSRNSNDIEGWLEDKKIEFGEAGSVLIEKIQLNMQLDDKYTEPYGNDGVENFIVVPLHYDTDLTDHIRTDLSDPLQYLLLVDSAGVIRSGNLIMFYPTNNISELPDSSFTQYYTQQTLSVDGTFALVSLNDIIQYEMDFENGDPTEQRLWESRAPLYEDDILCIDWYLVTTVYYTDGTIDVFEEFLYTQCYGGAGGGGGGSNGPVPPSQNHYTVTRNVSFIVAQQFPQGTLEHWTMKADYVLTGEYFPNNPSSNYFTAAPVAGGSPPNASSSIMWWGNSMHSVPSHVWYITFTFVSNTTGLTNSNKNAWANFSGILNYPNQPSKLPKLCNRPWNWAASNALF